MSDSAGHHDPRRRQEHPGEREGQVQRRAARTRIPASPATGIPALDISAKLTGTVNKARTRIKGTWQRKVVIYDPNDPTGVAVVDTCDTGVLKFTLTN